MTRKQRAALETVAWGTEHFGAVLTGRQTRLRDVLALVEMGLVDDAGMVTVCDGDGYALVPERFRQGWKITPKGTKALREDS